MQRIVVILLLVFMIPALAFARDAKRSEQTMMLRGYIVDNQCAAGKTDAQMDEFTKTHTKGCALSEACMLSGYQIYANHQFYKLDKKSSDKVAEFLKKSDTQLLISAEVKKEGNKVRLISIKNAE